MSPLGDTKLKLWLAVPDGPQDMPAEFRRIKMAKKSVSAHSYTLNGL